MKEKLQALAILLIFWGVVTFTLVREFYHRPTPQPAVAEKSTDQ